MEYSMENFINWCNAIEVTPANEGLKDILIDVKNIPKKIKKRSKVDYNRYRKAIDLTTAPRANNLEDVLKYTSKNTPIIEVSEKLADKAIKRKDASISTTIMCIGMDALAIIGLSVYPDLVTAFKVMTLMSTVAFAADMATSNNITNYRSYKGTNGKYYLLHQGYKAKKIET